jgi:hypothetical protein
MSSNVPPFDRRMALGERYCEGEYRDTYPFLQKFPEPPLHVIEFWEKQITDIQQCIDVQTFPQVTLPKFTPIPDGRTRCSSTSKAFMSLPAALISGSSSQSFEVCGLFSLNTCVTLHTHFTSTGSPCGRLPDLVPLDDPATTSMPALPDRPHCTCTAVAATAL